ncbi:MAG: hypothetical protein HQL40_16180 [Alphaproteobacteria bacterium]|nr:hypothetical protein [Alphaproteobacteria bacterium]
MSIAKTDLKPPKSGNYKIDSLVETGSSCQWDIKAALSGKNYVSVAFTPTGDDTKWWGSKVVGETALSSQQEDDVIEALLYASEITGITFVEANSAADADIVFAQGDLSGTTVGVTYSWASFTPGRRGTITDYDTEAVIVLDTTARSGNADPEPGTYGYDTILHELGHALRMKHPFDGRTQLPNREDNTDNTLMSYTESGTHTGRYAPYDLLALDYIYGGDGLGGEMYNRSGWLS